MVLPRWYAFHQVFVKDLRGKTWTFDMKSSDRVEDLKLRIQNVEGVLPDSQRLIFGGNQLEDDESLADYGILEGAPIHLVVRLLGGGYWRHFVDLENKDALHKIAFTYGGGLGWSKVSSGLNIEGKCTHTSCIAYGKRVVCPKRYCSFNVITSSGSSDSSDSSCNCPMCDHAIEATTCGFVVCEWMYKGRKKGRFEADITSEWRITGDEYERCREAGNMVDWQVLIITARRNPSPRPQCAICLNDMLIEGENPSLACGCRFHSHCLASLEDP